jgi:hypothetical protein
MNEAVVRDRLLLMLAGGLVACGSQSDLVRDTTAIGNGARNLGGRLCRTRFVRTTRDLGRSGVLVADADPEVVTQSLAHADAVAEIREVRATIPERVAALAGVGGGSEPAVCESGRLRRTTS